MIHLLDHGYIDFVDSWGSDEQIIRAARQSTDGAFRGWGPLTCPACRGNGRVEETSTDGDLWGGITTSTREVECGKCKGTGRTAGDERLLGHLYRHQHMSPFEMGGMIIEVKAPIFVFREWHRHRTQSYNEMSARYVPIPDEHYIPSVERLMLDGGANKQAQSTGAKLTLVGAEEYQKYLVETYQKQQEFYDWSLKMGVPKELARAAMPVGRYSKMWAQATLRNWMSFLTLRNHPDAQWEIRQYAIAVQDMLWERFPRTLELFEEGRDEHGN